MNPGLLYEALATSLKRWLIITAGCPLLQQDLVTKFIEKYHQKQSQYVSNVSN